jgi:hypothetical protein
VILALLIMRLLHIVLGVFWAGTLIFNALFLQPAMRDAGPDAAKVLAGLIRRRFLDIMPLVAFVTILAGLWLYWKDSSGFQASFMGSPFGIMIGLGALTGVVAFAVGLAVLRPAMLRAFALAQAAAAAAPPVGGRGDGACALRLTPSRWPRRAPCTSRMARTWTSARWRGAVPARRSAAPVRSMATRF